MSPAESHSLSWLEELPHLELGCCPAQSYQKDGLSVSDLLVQSSTTKAQSPRLQEAPMADPVGISALLVAHTCAETPGLEYNGCLSSTQLSAKGVAAAPLRAHVSAS
eukprot:CAMPEP_0172784748 /NCGR_PEP_ID=MMETSP1074-20121228/205097_1 /TAXON_ID=2916 /ORGANISM="Ceratium fusus, Strain PA161109" /LENGTH=106 /DNA_ID=CAMNT_0013621753 /DNA_START=261 /DNA_END=581 /DNA_ORIENTATION=+